MTPFDTWAARWNVPAAALADLRAMLIGDTLPPRVTTQPGSEAAVQVEERLRAAREGRLAFRNNVGALPNPEGVPVRFGLANDTKAMNLRYKSGDLIGIMPVLITPAHVGCTIGQFWSRECKHRGWRYTGTPREEAQLRWAQMVLAAGGDAGFATGRE